MTENNELIRLSNKASKLISESRYKQIKSYKKFMKRAKRESLIHYKDLFCLYTLGENLGQLHREKSRDAVNSVFYNHLLTLAEHGFIQNRIQIEEHIFAIRRRFETINEWIHKGRFYYKVEDTLGKMLSNTSIDNIPSDIIRLPAKNICIENPSHLNKIYKYTMLREFIDAKTNKKNLQIMLLNSMEDDFQFATLTLDPNYITILNDNRKYDKAAKELIHFSISLCMYLVSTDPDKESISSPSNKSRVHNGFILGNFIENTVTKINKDKVNTKEYPIANKYKQKLHMRAGHYKMQPCGKGKAQRKLIFISPYLAGIGDVLDSKTRVA